MEVSGSIEDVGFSKDKASCRLHFLHGSIGKGLVRAGSCKRPCLAILVFVLFQAGRICPVSYMRIAS